MYKTSYCRFINITISHYSNCSLIIPVFIIHEIAELLKKIMFFLLFVCLKYRYVHVHPVTSHSVSSCAVSRLTELKQQA